MILPAGMTEADFRNSQWVLELWHQMTSVHPGMTRTDLLRVFTRRAD